MGTTIAVTILLSACGADASCWPTPIKYSAHSGRLNQCPESSKCRLTGFAPLLLTFRGLTAVDRFDACTHFDVHVDANSSSAAWQRLRRVFALAGGWDFLFVEGAPNTCSILQRVALRRRRLSSAAAWTDVARQPLRFVHRHLLVGGASHGRDAERVGDRLVGSPAILQQVRKVMSAGAGVPRRGTDSSRIPDRL